METYFELTPYIIGTHEGDFIEIVCQNHAVNFAEERGLVWDNPSSFNYTEDEHAQGYAYADYFGELETDTPQSCTACAIEGVATYLGASLTGDGVEYLTDPTNNFPADVIKFYLGGN